MATTLEIIQGIAQAAANAYDGSHVGKYNSDGEERKIGLRREEGDPILDSRVIDGFKVKFKGNKLCVNYQSEISLKEVHKGAKFESEMEQTMANILKFLKKEYKKITGNTLALKPVKEVDIFVQPISRTRTDLSMYQEFEINSFDDSVLPIGEPSVDTAREVTKKFLALNSKNKRPENDTRPKDKKE
jgi:hypothetical protein